MSGSPKKYHMTVKAVMKWANKEIKHVGYIAGVEDPDIQYSYALSTVNGMLHLRDALYELVTDPAYASHKEDLQRTHDKVVRIVKHLIDEYKVDLDTIKTFNTRKVLSDLSYLKGGQMTSTSTSTVPTSTMTGGKRTRRRSRTRRN